MPCYDLKCKCGHVHDVLAPKMPKSAKCPACGGKATPEFPTPVYHNRYSPMHPKRKAGRG